MLDLSRTVRLCLNADHASAPSPKRSNPFAAWPPPRGLARYVELRVVCRGQAHPRTGYFINIRDIDDAVHAQPIDPDKANAFKGLTKLVTDIEQVCLGELGDFCRAAERISYRF